MMQGKKMIALLVAGALGLALAAGAGAQAPPPPPKTVPAPKVRQPLQQLTVEGKIRYMKAMGGYYIRGKTEVYIIANQNPQVLDALVKSGKAVTIVAKPSGDILKIISIDGKPYRGTEQPALK